MFGAVKLTKNADLGKYYYSRYGIGFVSCSIIADFHWGNSIIFGVDNSFPKIKTIRKVILVLGEGPIQQLDDTTIAAEAKYSIDFSRS